MPMTSEQIAAMQLVNAIDTFDLPICEVCGETEATCQTQHVGMCDDCFETSAREVMAPLMGNVCCNVSRNAAGYLQVCLAPYGVEHEHS